MTAKYRIEIELSLDELAATKAIELARDIYRQRGGARTMEDGVEREVSADEFIDSAEQALLELVEGCIPRIGGIEIGHQNCRLVPSEVDHAPQK